MKFLIKKSLKFTEQKNIKMRKLIDAINIDAPSGDYPKGRVRDKNGAILGTEYREVLHGDVFQFFQKLVIESGITENDLPDNVTNGYQLFEALTGTLGKWQTGTIVNGMLSTNTGTFSTGTGDAEIKFNVVGKKVDLQFSLNEMNHSTASVAEVEIDISSFFPSGVVGSWFSVARFTNSANPSYDVGGDIGQTSCSVSVDDVTNTIKIIPLRSGVNNFYMSGANNLFYQGQISFEIA